MTTLPLCFSGEMNSISIRSLRGDLLVTMDPALSILLIELVETSPKRKENSSKRSRKEFKFYHSNNRQKLLRFHEANPHLEVRAPRH